ncbi:uncharacterized protein LOC123292587 [Chrysoperla carnea]|uniref:uncharacterized protein LOC123292587 n=1 Tax=Chrysoperla carnea TaxID=189513 RepID=UPI001D09184F|nr:uncharacterized protein LOC123292587 [Chrysoperla carnea]
MQEKQQKTSVVNENSDCCDNPSYENCPGCSADFDNPELKTPSLKNAKKKRKISMNFNPKDSCEKLCGERWTNRQETDDPCYPEIKIENFQTPKKNNKHCVEEGEICSENKEDVTCDAEIKVCVDNYTCRKCPACRSKNVKCKRKHKIKVKKEEESFHETSFVECGICENDADAYRPCKPTEVFCNQKDCSVAKVYESTGRNIKTDIIDDTEYPSRCCYKTVIIDSREIPIDEEACPVGRCGPKKELEKVYPPRKLCQTGNYCASDVKKEPCPEEKPKYTCSRTKCVDECSHVAKKINKKARNLKELFDPDNRKRKYLYSDRPLLDCKPDQVFEKYDGDKKHFLYKYPIKGVCPHCKGLNMSGKLCYVPEKVKEEKITLKEKFREMYKIISFQK